MFTKTAAVGLISFLLGATTSASPIEARGPGPVERWVAASFIDSSCSTSAFQNFSGSGSVCSVVEDMHPPAQFIVEIKSILIGSIFGTYDFSFLQGSECAITGLNDAIYEVSSGESLCVPVSNPGSMNTENVSPPITTLKSRLLPESIWDATFYSDNSCDGAETSTFQGSSGGCQLVSGLLESPGTVPAETNSILISATFGDYDFTFYDDENCEATNLAELIYSVSSGQSLCVQYSDAVSFDVEDVTASSKKRSVLPARQGPIDSWSASAFSGAGCTGTALENIGGLETSCDDLSSSGIGSVLITAYSESCDFVFYPLDQCATNGINEEIYSVTAGQSSCIDLGFSPESIQATVA